MEAQIMQFHSRDDVDAQIERLEALLAAFHKRKMMEAKASEFGMLDIDEEDE